MSSLSPLCSTHNPLTYSDIYSRHRHEGGGMLDGMRGGMLDGMRGGGMLDGMRG